MSRLVELKFTVSRINSVTRNENVLGLAFCEMILTRKSEEVVTDRLMITDEGIRILNAGR